MAKSPQQAQACVRPAAKAKALTQRMIFVPTVPPTPTPPLALHASHARPTIIRPRKLPPVPLVQLAHSAQPMLPNVLSRPVACATKTILAIKPEQIASQPSNAFLHQMIILISVFLP